MTSSSRASRADDMPTVSGFISVLLGGEPLFGNIAPLEAGPEPPIRDPEEAPPACRGESGAYRQRWEGEAGGAAVAEHRLGAELDPALLPVSLILRCRDRPSSARSRHPISGRSRSSPPRPHRS